MATALLIALAGVMGAVGIALAAAAAHTPPGANLGAAAQMLLFHASAVMALVAAADRALVWRPLALIAAGGLVAGATLFAGDIAMRALVQARLLPMAAPTGGLVMIAAWLAVVAAGLLALRHR
jgi:uncharacterized membrane protein YgdD (TMEM256/DUF423 family)